MGLSLLYYGAAVVLVAGMINGLAAWRALAGALGEGAAAGIPIVAALAGLGAALIPVIFRRDRTWVRLGLLAAALVLVAAGLVIADPAFPAKRIHVVEYLAVAWLIHGGLSGRLRGWARPAAATLLATLLGVHDELAQGLHPDRGFGAIDMAINALGAAAGALVARAAGPMRDGFARPARGARHVFVFAGLLCVTLPFYPAAVAVFGWEFR